MVSQFSSSLVMCLIFADSAFTCPVTILVNLLLLYESGSSSWSNFVTIYLKQRIILYLFLFLYYSFYFQKKRGFIFCKEDRAVLCRECDLSIHTTSDLTRQHTRYLLTGVQLSSAPISSTPTIVEDEEEVGDGSLYNVYNRDDAGASISVLTETDSNVNTNNTQYFINAKYGWHVEEIMLNNAATTSTPAINIDPMFISSSQYYQVGNNFIYLSIINIFIYIF